MLPDHLGVCNPHLLGSKPYHFSLTTHFSFDLGFAELKLSRKLFCKNIYFSDLTSAKLSSQENVQTHSTLGESQLYSMEFIVM